jgi:hypothetical protein
MVPVRSIHIGELQSSNQVRLIVGEFLQTLSNYVSRVEIVTEKISLSIPWLLEILSLLPHHTNPKGRGGVC